jgi:putative Ca2+/H+ antiporter (TMEM165/GDT1 family)
VEWLPAALSAFAVVVPVELPDKTFVATLVLSTRYRPLPVWAGATTAFAVQCAVAATAGRIVALLPEAPVRIAAAVLFAVGAGLLLRGARDGEQRTGAEHSPGFAENVGAEPATVRGTGWRAFGATFVVLFLAEWGDLSQLLTVGLVASGRPAVPVFFGSWLGLAFVAGLGVLLGRVILRHVRLRVVRYVGAAVCLVLSVVIVYQVVAAVV